MSKIYSKICSLCDSKDMTITEMCRITGISRSTMSELKAGRSQSLSAKNIMLISNYFEIPIEFLMGKGVFSNWERITKEIDPVFWALQDEIPPGFMWHEDDEKSLFPYLHTRCYYGGDVPLFVNWLFESVDLIDFFVNEEHLQYKEAPEFLASIQFKEHFKKRMDSYRKEQEAKDRMIKATPFSELFSRFIEEHQMDTSSEDIEELVGVFKRLNFSSKRQLIGKAYELLDAQSRQCPGEEVTPPDISVVTAVHNSGIKK